MSRRFRRPLNACRRATAFALGLLALVTCVAPARAQSSQDPVYVFHTTLGDMRVQLFPDVTPQTVANFLNYVNRGAYNSSFIHRVTTVANTGIAVVQGGGYVYSSTSGVSAIPTDAPVQNEFSLPNTRGTIAMAKTSDPNSATDEWFFNDVDNSASLDNPQNSGGFTVFGKIVDSASLAVMDRIAAVQTYNEGSPFDQLPLVDYSGSGNVTASNFVTVTSIAPAWSATSLSVGADGLPRLLWDNAAGTSAFWRLSAGNGFLDQQQYGPFPGWAAKSIATGPDGNTRALWTNANGTAAFWRLNGQNQLLDQQQYGPFSGWTAQSVSVGSDGNTRALWTNADGTAAFWLLDASNRFVSQQQYGPFPGWAAHAISAGPGGITRVLWTNANGTAAFWRMDANNNYLDQQQYGPFSGWTAQSVASAPDGTGRALWTNADGTAAFWLLGTSNHLVSQQQYGPFSGGWSAQGVATAPDGTSRALWANVSGQTALWSLDGANNFTGQQQYGPF